MKISEQELKNQVKCCEAKPGVYSINVCGVVHYSLVSEVRDNGGKYGNPKQTIIVLNTMQAADLDYYHQDSVRYYEFITDKVNVQFEQEETVTKKHNFKM